MISDLNILIRGPLWTGWTSGYCSFTRDIFKLFRAITPNVKYQFNRSDRGRESIIKKYFSTQEELYDRYHDGDDINVFDMVLNIGTPTEIKFIPHFNNVLYTFWETDLINTYDLDCDPSWVRQMNQYNEVWSSCSFANDVFKKSGVTSKLRIIRWPIVFDEVRADPDEKIVFRCLFENKEYSLDEIVTKHECIYFSCGEFQPRKNFEQMIQSFLIALGKNNKACLVLKCSLGAVSQFKGITDLIEYLESQFDAFSEIISKIYIVCSHISKNALMYLHDKSSFYVTTSRGEGLGGPVVDAMGLGKPIIAHRFSSFKDFLNQDNAILFNHHLEYVTMMPFPTYSSLQKWAAFRTQDIVDAFVCSYELFGTAQYTSLSNSARGTAIELFEFNNVKDNMIDILG